MENRNTILNELKEISPAVAAIGNQPTYTVPDDYFENFAMQVMFRMAIEEKAGAEPVLNIHKDNVYQLPAGYFDSLAANVINRIKAQETENPKEELELLSPLLSGIGKKNPFTPPEGYFIDISENIVAGVKAIDFVNEELENLSPVMLGLKDKQVYQAPDGYFDTLAASVLNKAKHQQSAKIVSIGFGKKTMRYAVAALVAGIIAVSGYVMYNKPATSGTIAVTKTVWDSATIAKISDLEIENFVTNNTVSLADVATNDGTVNANDIKDLLADVSDEELQHYLEQDGSTPNSITN